MLLLEGERETEREKNECVFCGHLFWLVSVWQTSSSRLRMKLTHCGITAEPQTQTDSCDLEAKHVSGRFLRPPHCILLLLLLLLFFPVLQVTWPSWNRKHLPVDFTLGALTWSLSLWTSGKPVHMIRGVFSAKGDLWLFAEGISKCRRWCWIIQDSDCGFALGDLMAVLAFRCVFLI